MELEHVDALLDADVAKLPEPLHAEGQQREQDNVDGLEQGLGGDQLLGRLFGLGR